VGRTDEPSLLRRPSIDLDTMILPPEAPAHVGKSVRRYERLPDVKFPPVVNGLDYLEAVVDDLQGEPAPRNVKYAVLHLLAGTEVLLKARLAEEHWTLVFDNPGQATQEKWASGDFRSCTVVEAFDRLAEIGGVELSGNARTAIVALRDKRNRLQHFGLTDSAHAIQAVAISVLNMLVSFVTEHLADEEDPVPREMLERIRSRLGGIEQLVSFRLDELKEMLDSRDLIVTCPRCGQFSLEPGDECVCHFCGTRDDPEGMAREYVYTVLGENEYSAAKGRTTWSLTICPECEHETLVTGVVVRGHNPDREGLFACCFADASAWADREMGECMHCGRPIPIEEEGPDLCGDCLAAAIDRF
jgi:hypothetical protein